MPIPNEEAQEGEHRIRNNLNHGPHEREDRNENMCFEMPIPNEEAQEGEHRIRNNLNHGPHERENRTSTKIERPQSHLLHIARLARSESHEDGIQNGDCKPDRVQDQRWKHRIQLTQTATSSLS